MSATTRRLLTMVLAVSATVAWVGPASAYTVQKGDSLWTIAAKTLGDPYRWQEILKANPQLGDGNRLEVGDTLVIATKEGFEDALKAGEAARKAAAKVGHEWRDTKKFLKQAKKAAESGDYAKATRLANKAREQGELGVKQAAEQKMAWKNAVVR